MDLNKWYKKRGPKFVLQRGTNLLDRYGVSSKKAVRRIEDCIGTLAGLGCAPTFPTPGIIVQRYPQVIRHFQQLGAEIAVHSFQHVNLRDLPLPEAKQQLLHAFQIFEHLGIDVHGFRCPYLNCPDNLSEILPKGMFAYSSNQAVMWDIEPLGNSNRGRLMFERIGTFYSPRSARTTVCVPWMIPGSDMVEIPVCVPDDLMLYDGLLLNIDDIAQAWYQVLHTTHQRGELFNLMFHPELADAFEAPFTKILHEALTFRPQVWIARSMDISKWWKEKAGFKVEITPINKSLQLNFTCSSRATILVRGLDFGGSLTPWDNGYSLLKDRTLVVPSNPHPFIGIGSDVPGTTISFLSEQGYFLDTAETARSCGIYLDGEMLAKLPNNVELINYIETSPAPLVRYWRWPDGAKSSLSFTGDLDALSLLDYVSRLFI